LKNGDQIECGDTIFEVTVTSPEEDKESTRELPPRGSVTETVNVPPPAPPLSRLGDYLLDRELGRGSMGVVYYATHQPTGRAAAVKLIQPTAPSKLEAMKLFLREAMLLGKLRHPRIVEYLSHGLHEGQMFLAT